jgi:palmitoyl-protein thioesterase
MALFALFLGVSDIPNCVNPRDFTCNLMRSMVRRGVYTDYIQNRVVQAQYFRDPNNYDRKFDLNSLDHNSQH